MITKARILCLFGGISTGLMGWLAISTLVMFFAGSPAILVVAPSQEFLAKLPANVTIVSVGQHTITLASGSKNLARHLYDAGAVFLFPSGVDGCIPYPGEATKA